MNYEKKYKDALERAKKFEEKYGGGYAEYIFPELAESEDEDERIREWLVNYFKAAGKSWIHRDISPEQILAYLEKQKERVPENEETGTRKEQKPEWSEEDENNIGWIVAFLQGEEGSGEVIELMRESLISWLRSLRPQYHGDVTMTEAYKMGLEAGKVSSWKPSEHQMTILKAVKDYVGKGSGYWGEALGSLIEDLEKL